jgi:hypothetical protein
MPTDDRARYFTAGGLTAAIFLLYLATLSPSVAMWDAGEYVAAARTIGVPHQPGNPLFLLIAHVAGLLPLSETYAVRINILAAACGALTAGLWFLCGERILRPLLAHRGHWLVAAGTAAMLGAGAFTVWNQSVVMEKVYPLALLGLSLVSWLLLVWVDVAADDDRRGSRLLVLIAYLMGLTYAIHPAGLLTGPAVLLAVLRHRPVLFCRWKLAALAAVAFIAGTTPFAVLPIRAAHQPYINESAVSACEDGTIAAGCTFSAETARRLKGTIEREQYGGNAVLERRGPMTAQLGMFWLYFRWQWMRDATRQSPFAQEFVALAMLGLGLAGLLALRAPGRTEAHTETRTEARTAALAAHRWYLVTLAVTFTVALVYYLNFRYGFSQRPDLADLVAREPRDRDYFFMWTFSLWGLLAGLGLAYATRALKARLAVPILAVAALLPLGANWSAASRTGQGFTTEWAKDLLMSLEPNAIIITSGDNDTFPLWYAQAVEGHRPDVTVALTEYMGMDWYPRQLNLRAKLWNMDDRTLDSVPPRVAVAEGSRFAHGDIKAVIPTPILARDQLLILYAIRDSFPRRPVYFAVGNYGSGLGLDPYIKRVGLVNQLMPEPVREGPDTAFIGGAFVDVPRSLELWRKYGGAQQVVREGRWVDASTLTIPLYYAGVGHQLAMALESRGRTAEAGEVLALAHRVANALR